jgi:type IX secretion system PorP/SprF family membrane protein
MKRTLNFILVGIALSFVSIAFTQQTKQTNMYAHNKYAMNPAYAGASGCTEVNFSHISQWVKVAGAPRTNTLNANTRLGKSLGIGGNVLLDKLGMLQQISASASVSYGITIAQQHKVRLGVTGGYFQMRVDPTDAIAFDAGDNIVEGGVNSSNSINTEAGILYQFKGLELSFASKQLIETRSDFNYSELDGYGLKRHFTGYASYAIVLKKSLSLTPSVMYKGIKGTQQFDFNADLNYNDFIYGGLGYRTEVGLIGRIGINIKRLFFVGYSYEVPMQNIASYGAGSHEVVLGLKFCKKDKELPEELISEVDQVEPRVDTVLIHDTLIVERIDTVFVEKVVTITEPSNDNVRKAMFQASDHLEFEHDKSIIVRDSYADLEALVNILLVREDVEIELDGHTDSDGTEEYNIRLSRNRVEAVKYFLVANGVAKSRIKTSHFGESRPIADNKTEEGKAKNRRVEMRIIEK